MWKCHVSPTANDLYLCILLILLFIISCLNSSHTKTTSTTSTTNVITIAGSGRFRDGLLSVGSFNFPHGIAIDSNGDIIVVDTFNNRIRRISLLTGTVRTVAGTGDFGYRDGPSSVAMFNVPMGIAIDANDDIIVADWENHRIRRISVSTGIVSTIAGCGEKGFEDGPAAIAKFYHPIALAIHLGHANQSANLYPGDIIVADQDNHSIRRISASTGTVTTIAGIGKAGFLDANISSSTFNGPNGIAFDLLGDIIVVDSRNNKIRRISLTAGHVTTIAGSSQSGFKDGSLLDARFRNPSYITIHSNGDMIVSDSGNNRIRKISISTGLVTTIAGNDDTEFSDGSLSQASFSDPRGVALNSKGDIIVADQWNHRIRSISITGQIVTTITGIGEGGFRDGHISMSQFHNPYGLARDLNGDIIIADLSNHRIRKISVSTWLVSTVAGNGKGESNNGKFSEASFHSPIDVAIDRNGNIIVSDEGSHLIRKISISEGTVTTIAGSEGPGFKDGPAHLAKFHKPAAVTVDFNGDIIIADRANNCIRKLSTLTGMVNTVAGKGMIGFNDGNVYDALFNEPSDVSISPNGDIIVVDQMNHCIRKISNGIVSTIAGIGKRGFRDGSIDEAMFDYPSSIYIDSDGNIIVADMGNNCIRRVSTSKQIITTIAGSRLSGFVDGPGSDAQFNAPFGVTTDPNGDVIVADRSNNGIRMIHMLPGIVKTIVANGKPGFRDGSPLDAEFKNPMGMAIDSKGDIIVADTLNNRIRKILVSSGMVYTIAGTGISGFSDDVSHKAMFNEPKSVAVDPNGDIIVADSKNHKIRKISVLNGTVSTIAGSDGGFEDGISSIAKFSYPSDVAIDIHGDIIVADYGNHRIRKVLVSNGTVISIAGNGIPGLKEGDPSQSQFHHPSSVEIFSNNTIYVADTTNHVIRMIDVEKKAVSTVSGINYGYQDGSSLEAKFYQPTCIRVNANGDLIVADSGNNRIRIIRLVTYRVDTLAGSGISGIRDDTATLAQFNNPSGIAIDPNGDILIADQKNHVIRKIVNHPCPIGKFSNTTFISSVRCFSCFPGTYSDERGATVCSLCQPGRYNPLANNHQCYPCPVGEFSLEGQANCTFCPKGHFNFKEGQSKCDPCGPGFITSIEGQANCTACAAGYFAPQMGQSKCTPCSEGFFSKTEGQATCMPCNPGTFASGGGKSECDPCPTGYFNPLIGQSKCSPCPAGNYSNIEGQEKCSPCEKGRYSNEGQTNCNPCPRGQYNDKIGQKECNSCPSGFVSEEGYTNCQFFLTVQPYVTLLLISITVAFLTMLIFVISICILHFYSMKMRKKHEEKLELRSLLLDDTSTENPIPLDIDISLFEIDIEELTELKEIGSGGSGCLVLKAKRNNRDVVVKLFRYSSLDESGLEQFMNELKFYMSLRDKNVVYFYGACMKPPRIGIVMEYCPNGTLKEYLRNNKLSFKKKLELTIEIADGMDYLHTNQVIHRDLKSENILIDNDCHAKIADFGISKSLGQEANTVRVGTGVYMAPEVTLGKSYNEKCDVFSFAIIMYEILTENFSPYGHNADNVEFRVANNPTFRPIIPDDIHIDGNMAKYVVLMTNCWNHEPDSRPSFCSLSKSLRNLGNQDWKAHT